MGNSKMLRAFLTVALAAVVGACGDSSAGRDVTGPIITGPVRAAASLEAVTPTSLTGVVGSTIPGSPAVRVKDASGNSLGGVIVTFVRQGSIRSSVMTGSDGTASFGSWTLGTLAGSQTLVASVVGVGEVVVFTVEAAPGPAARIVRDAATNPVGDAGKSVGAMAARVVDAFGNPVQGVTVRFAVTAGGGTIDASPVITDGNGVARGGEWVLGAVGIQEVQASSPGLPSETFSAVALPPEAERVTYVLESINGWPVLDATQILVLTSVVPGGSRPDEPLFFAGSMGNLSWGQYAVSNGGIRLDIVSGDWLAWAETPMVSGWHSQQEIGLSVWSDGPSIFITYIYRRKL